MVRLSRCRSCAALTDPWWCCERQRHECLPRCGSSRGCQPETCRAARRARSPIGCCCFVLSHLHACLERWQPSQPGCPARRPAGEHGDLHVVLRTLPHPHFERRGDGLMYNATISLLEALVGFEREVGAGGAAGGTGCGPRLGGQARCAVDGPPGLVTQTTTAGRSVDMKGQLHQQLLA